jgi:hypothetical protein
MKLTNQILFDIFIRYIVIIIGYLISCLFFYFYYNQFLYEFESNFKPNGYNTPESMRIIGILYVFLHGILPDFFILL